VGADVEDVEDGRQKREGTVCRACVDDAAVGKSSHSLHVKVIRRVTGATNVEPEKAGLRRSYLPDDIESRTKSCANKEVQRTNLLANDKYNRNDLQTIATTLT